MKEKIRKILNLAIPATIENILQALVGFVDTLLIAHISLSAVTAIGIANNIIAVYLAVFIALGVGTSSLISRKIGGEKVEEAKNIAIQSTNIAIIAGLIFGIVTIIFGKTMLTSMGATGDSFTQALQFFYLVVSNLDFFIHKTDFGLNIFLLKFREFSPQIATSPSSIKFSTEAS